MTTPSSFQGYTCWNHERISQVINKEAISVDIPTFMATHTPLPHIQYLTSPQQMTSTSEQGLLDELLTREHQDQHAFVVIQGVPGTGKSHLIRWLKERYHVETLEGNTNHVILIERANNSLLGTLRQILDSSLFDIPSMRQQLDKLRMATETLSQKAREETLLDNLRIATFEVQLPEEKKPKIWIRKHIEHFLLDVFIRTTLINGPIRRISTTLIHGLQTDAQDENMFTPDDFQFTPEFLRQLKHQGAYQDTIRFTESLQTEEKREELAHYLNHLLRFAIGRTTMLSADDLRQMFNDLRRHFRQEGHTLTLFIEDITSFSGVDTGLIDVLATQHTGESNREFCRIMSIVGITDSYYQDRFPDNLRERVTHRLTLNATNDTTSHAAFLEEQSHVAQLSAHYLNAMRVSAADLQTWSQQGSRPEHLPNACVGCPYRSPCHTAFGNVHLNEDDEESAIGLYPFNAQSLWTMYQRLDQTEVNRTPRALLNSILLYVLQSHGQRIADRTFPPPPHHLGVHFTAPHLRYPQQQRTIHDQATSDAPRVETLLLFWGDQTAYSTGNSPQRLIGGVPEAVFHAFAVPAIPGIPQTHAPTHQTLPPTRQAPQSTQPSHIVPAEPRPSYQPVEISTVPLQSHPVQPTHHQHPSTPKESKYITDITAWMRGGKLRHYEKLRTWLVAYITSAIDWEAYGIKPQQQQERLRDRRFTIENQSGAVKGVYYTFKQSHRLAYALYGLVALNDKSTEINPAAIATHLTNLRVWVRSVEPDLVTFIQGYTHDPSTPHLLLRPLLTSTLAINCLTDNLNPSLHDPATLLLHLIDRATAYTNTTSFNRQWGETVERIQTTHNSYWSRILKGLNPDHVRRIHEILLNHLNLPQGTSSRLSYIDSPQGLDIITSILSSGWEFASLPNFVIESIQLSDSVWEPIIAIYSSLQQHFHSILDAEREHLRTLVTNINMLLDQQPPSEVHGAINSLLTLLRQQQVSYNSHFDKLFNPKALASALKSATMAIHEQRTTVFALQVSAQRTAVMLMHQTLESLTQFIRDMEALEATLDTTIHQLTGTREHHLHTKIATTYTAIEDSLQRIIRMTEGEFL